MYKQKTDELEEILEKTHPSQIESYIENCTDEMLTEGRDFMRYMNEKFKEKKMEVVLQNMFLFLLVTE